MKGRGSPAGRAASWLGPRPRLVKINVDENPAVAECFAVRSIPTRAIARHGRELARSAGAMSAAQLEAWALEQLAA